MSKKREPVTINSYLGKIDEIISTVDVQIHEMSISKEKVGGVRSLKKIRKDLLNLKKKTPLLIKESKRRKSRSIGSSPVHQKYSISQQLSVFLSIDTSNKMSRAEVTSALCVYINIKPDEKREAHCKWKYLNSDGRNLQNPENKHHIVPDEKLSSLLGYERYQHDVKKGAIVSKSKDKGEVVITDSSLTYLTLQRLITPHLSKI